MSSWRFIVKNNHEFNCCLSSLIHNDRRKFRLNLWFFFYMVFVNYPKLCCFENYNRILSWFLTFRRIFNTNYKLLNLNLCLSEMCLFLPKCVWQAWNIFNMIHCRLNVTRSKHQTKRIQEKYGTFFDDKAYDKSEEETFYEWFSMRMVPDKQCFITKDKAHFIRLN